MNKCYWNDERVKALVFDSMMALSLCRMPTSRELFDHKTPIEYFDPTIPMYAGRQPDKLVKGGNVDQIINRFGGYIELANRYKLRRIDQQGKVIFPNTTNEE